MPKILRNLYFYIITIDWSLEQLNRNPAFCKYFGTLNRYHVNMNKLTIYKTYNFWVTWPGLRNIVAIRGRRKNVYFSKIALWTRLHGWEYLETFLCGIRNKPEYLGRWLRCHEFVFKCSQRGPPKDEDLLFLSFWTNFRNNWGVATNISLIFIVLL